MSPDLAAAVFAESIGLDRLEVLLFSVFSEDVDHDPGHFVAADEFRRGIDVEGHGGLEEIERLDAAAIEIELRRRPHRVVHLEVAEAELSPADVDTEATGRDQVGRRPGDSEGQGSRVAADRARPTRDRGHEAVAALSRNVA